jgi:hypothetical protein
MQVKTVSVSLGHYGVFGDLRHDPELQLGIIGHD